MLHFSQKFRVRDSHGLRPVTSLSRLCRTRIALQRFCVGTATVSSLIILKHHDHTMVIPLIIRQRPDWQAGTIWRAVIMACHGRSINIKNWERVLPVAVRRSRCYKPDGSGAFLRTPSAAASRQSLPSLPADSVLLKSTGRASRYEPMVGRRSLYTLSQRTPRSDFPVVESQACWWIRGSI